MKKFIVVISLLAALSFSCKPLEENDPIDEKGVTKRTFYVNNFKTDGHDSVETGLLAEGKKCHVWVGRGANVSKEKAGEIAKIYDDDIDFKLMYYFSFNEDDGVIIDGEKVKTTMDIVDYLVNWDGKLNIVLVDITDKYEKGKNNSYTGGYFWAGDLYETKDVKYSNECAVIFIDTNPAVPGSDESNSTLAHEMQHLINFLNSFVYRDGNTFETWVDEGLSLSSEYMYLEDHLKGRVNHYKNDPSGLLCKGNNFCVWGNRTDESQYAVLDDYATDYLFFQWLRAQTDLDIYSWIMFSNFTDYNAIVGAYNNMSSASNKVNGWDSLLKIWLASNQIKAPTGQYGYKGELTDIKAHPAPAQTSIALYPGEGVYSNTPSKAATPSGNIKYAYLTGTSANDTYSSGVTTLLTYNKNTNKDGSKETGTTTGAASVQTVPDARFIAALHNEPIQIDARDMMGRDKWQESYSKGVSGLRKGAK